MAIFLVDGGNSRGRNRKVHPKTPRAFRGLRRAGQPRGRGTEGNSRGLPRALNSQWRWQILTKSTFWRRGVVPLFSRSSPARRSVK